MKKCLVQNEVIAVVGDEDLVVGLASALARASSDRVRNRNMVIRRGGKFQSKLGRHKEIREFCH